MVDNANKKKSRITNNINFAKKKEKVNCMLFRYNQKLCF